MAGCRKPMKKFVERGFRYLEVTVRCGQTSPSGEPWLCEACAKANRGRDWRREAEQAGETWGPEDY